MCKQSCPPAFSIGKQWEIHCTIISGVVHIIIIICQKAAVRMILGMQKYVYIKHLNLVYKITGILDFFNGKLV